MAASLARQPLSDLDDPLAYLRVVMLRRAANERRRLGRKRRADQRIGPAPGVSPATYPSDLEELAQLDPEDRALIYLTEVEGMTLTDVAGLFGRSAGPLKIVPGETQSVRITLADGYVRKAVAIGDASQYGVRFFASVDTEPAGALRVIDALAADGSVLATTALGSP